jgi:hypothetical protein
MSSDDNGLDFEIPSGSKVDGFQQGKLVGSTFEWSAQQPVDDCLRVLGSLMLAGNALPPVMGSFAEYLNDALNAAKDDRVRPRPTHLSPMHRGGNVLQMLPRSSSLCQSQAC